MSGSFLFSDLYMIFCYTVQLESPDETRKTIVGTPYWMVPELIKSLLYSYGVNILSLGIMCRELAEVEPL